MFGIIVSFLCGAFLGVVLTVKALRFFFRTSGLAVRVLLGWTGFSAPRIDASRPVPAAR